MVWINKILLNFVHDLIENTWEKVEVVVKVSIPDAEFILIMFPWLQQRIINYQFEK